MARIWSMMDVGRQSLMNSKTALQTVAHNIANRSTPGYSRQRVEFQTNQPVDEGRVRVGMGAHAQEVTRINNGFIEKQLEHEGNQLGYANTRADLLGRVEQVYNEQVNKGLNHSMGRFFNAFRALSNNPESMATRTQVKEAGDFLAKDFQKVHQQLQGIQGDADFRIKTKVTEINQITKEIAQLNEKIQTVELNGTPANDERDRRDLLVKKLGGLVNVRYAESKSGQLTITAGNTAVLVSGFEHRDLAAVSTPASKNKAEGDVDIFYKSTDSGTPINVTRQLTGGEIGGLLQVRDHVINDFQNKMDHMAYTLAYEVNRAHVDGYDHYGQKGGLFFNMPEEVSGAADKLSLSKSVMTDVGRIAAGAAPNAPGDNRVANIIADLQYKKVMGGGTSTIGDFYNTLVGKVGVEAQQANSAQSSQKDIVKQLKNIRESVSGVSLDEETAKMIEFQKNFDASARLIRTADEMMDTVLNLKRL